MTKKRMLVVAVVLLILALAQVGSAGARHLTCEITTKVWLEVDCEQVCVGVENLSGVQGTTLVQLFFDDNLVGEAQITIPAGETVYDCHSWEELGVEFDPLVSHTVHVTTSDSEASVVLGPCEEPPMCQSELIAGQHFDAGYVNVWDDGENLHVQFETQGDWSLGETHLYVGTVAPKKAAPGKFPYSGADHYVIPLSEFDGACELYIAAHAVVYNGAQQETAWGDTYGVPIRRNNWAMYFGYNSCADGCFTPE